MYIRADFYKSIWFWWFLTTFVYVVLNLFEFPGSNATFFGYVAGFIGLFVPYGLTSLILFISIRSWISLIVFVVLMKSFDKKLEKGNYSIGKRITLNLLALLVLTTIVDLVRGTGMASWLIFYYGATPLHF